MWFPCFVTLTISRRMIVSESKVLNLVVSLRSQNRTVIHAMVNNQDYAHSERSYMSNQLDK